LSGLKNRWADRSGKSDTKSLDFLYSDAGNDYSQEATTHLDIRPGSYRSHCRRSSSRQHGCCVWGAVCLYLAFFFLFGF